ncbi:MAG: tRNA (N6-isopentenyl adenosine(37)-C2)-methylthiotransferase MiaB [Flavobacteriales bacterium]|nr:tRNA (N6-isopentenyl adenosine(37)-C2)-methylthiotransferase MiaB [Flavobacteriales bacterium]MCB9190974.1 tRNA (N6-isopentenyl adenosine(37)-C2)-methylthiotransferase MiaB [Flavobacteriales bacterium]MCB9204791.1 tRNA (N6-isopentenyl adenosine(37)-C2)-methylthiotransferase MiaB [Flavobacteriales bacterium]
MRNQDISVKEIDETRQGEALEMATKGTGGKKLYIESYGCAMNFSDSEIVASVLIDEGFETTKVMEEADVIFVNTCAIRDNAEQRVRGRLDQFRKAKKSKPEMVIGVMGCMAERLKSKLLEEEKLVDIVVGPDSYRDLPNLVRVAESGQKAVNVLLSREETYADINPVRLGGNGVSAFVSITRGCDNMCSFCVVPFTRGRERSRDPESIVAECKQLFENGYKEVTLLGQNVDSYLWGGGGLKKDIIARGDLSGTISFAELLIMVAQISPELRVRFSTSHPKDMHDDVLYAMAKYHNICSYIHLPVQSGSTRLLELMNRGYTREWYFERMAKIKEIVPDCGLSTDIITGFCTETEEDHQDTLSLMEEIGFDFAYMFKYSERPGTAAAKKMEDDIPEEIKQRRLAEVIEIQAKNSHESNKKDLGKTFQVLVEGTSKKSDEMLQGRNPQNKVVVFPKEDFKKGDYVNVLVTDCTSATLLGTAVK